MILGFCILLEAIIKIIMRYTAPLIYNLRFARRHQPIHNLFNDLLHRLGLLLNNRS